MRSRFYRTTNLVIIILSVVLIHKAPGQAAANQTTKFDFTKYRRDHLSVGIAGSYAYFNSSVTYFNKTENRNIHISPEGTLGLDKTQFIPTIYGFWHPARRHWIGFSYFTIQREGDAVSVDRDLDDIEVKGNIYMSDRSSFYFLSYNYLLFYDNRSFVAGAIGIYGIHLRSEIRAEGEIEIDNELSESRYYNEITNFWIG